MDSLTQSIYENYIENQFARIEGFDFKNLDVLRGRLEKEFFYTYRPSYQAFMPREKEARILELGSGFGRFAYFCEKLGFKSYTGVDLSKDGIELCRKLFPAYTFVQDDFLHFFQSDMGKYDVIFLSHVIEHFAKKDLAPFLTAIREKLSDTGRVIITTPNASAYFGDSRLRYIDFTHEIAFTPESLEEVLSISSFEVLESSNRKLNLPFYKRWIHETTRFFFGLLISALGYNKEKIYTPDFFTVAKKKS